MRSVTGSTQGKPSRQTPPSDHRNELLLVVPHQIYFFFSRLTLRSPTHSHQSAVAVCTWPGTMRTLRLAVVGLEAFLTVAMFDQACAQGTQSQFKSPFNGKFPLANRTCSWWMPNWACCCPVQHTFLNALVSGTTVEAIAEQQLGESPKVPVNVSGLSESLQFLRIRCSREGYFRHASHITARGTTDEPRKLSTRTDVANDEIVGTATQRFQLSRDNSRLYWTFTLYGHVNSTIYEVSMACTYARSPSAHTEPPTTYICTSSASALFNPPTMATLPAAFAFAYLFQAAMALAC